MGEKIVFMWDENLDELVTKRMKVAVALLIGHLYRNGFFDGDTLGMVLNSAYYPIKEEMKQLLRDIENHSLMRVRQSTEQDH
jgi:hypothetical protein